MIPSQMLKGVLEGSVLAIISRQETYGYEISQELERYGFGKITEGTIYPLLMRLEKQGSIKSELLPSPLGPKRKYFTVTPAGRDYLESFENCWRRISESVTGIIGKRASDSVFIGEAAENG